MAKARNIGREGIRAMAGFGVRNRAGESVLQADRLWIDRLFFDAPTESRAGTVVSRLSRPGAASSSAAAMRRRKRHSHSVATRIAILGGGFAGVTAACELERRAPADAHITLVNRENFQLFTPMLPEVASGTLDMRAIVQPLRVPLGRRSRRRCCGRPACFPHG